ncbi:U6 snRNA phosphodiesterase [Esox lucius]|uniref:U6 snRNA phosphodiesterase n=1 Tax=Esox lucius TaxID=8010 RepID=A0A3P8ZVW9_ESOLU|nr:U6 snRNA phosphodiesterase [Esox lucius]
MLVSYSSSSEEETENIQLKWVTKRRQSWHEDDSLLRKKPKSEEHPPRAREEDDTKSRLPFPSSVLDMFTEEDENSQTEDRTLHGGRIRSFKHERGNWATYVYFPYIPEEGFLELLDEMTKVAASHGISLIHTDEFHLSLSKTVILKHHWIQPFIKSLKTSLAHIRRFICSAEMLKVYCNDDKNRTFLAMEFSTGQAQLLELMKAVDSTMMEFNLDTFYKDPSFHVSLAWCVGDCTEHIQKECLQDLQSLVDSHEDGPFMLRLDCQELRFKSGNKTFSFPLR